jgi:hypothetical protein
MRSASFWAAFTGRLRLAGARGQPCCPAGTGSLPWFTGTAGTAALNIIRVWILATVPTMSYVSYYVVSVRQAAALAATLARHRTSDVRHRVPLYLTYDVVRAIYGLQTYDIVHTMSYVYTILYVQVLYRFWYV